MQGNQGKVGEGVAKFTTAENKGNGPPRVHRRVSLHNVEVALVIYYA